MNIQYSPINNINKNQRSYKNTKNIKLKLKRILKKNINKELKFKRINK